MRKLALLLAVALVVAFAAPAVAKRVVNESYKEFQIQAYMDSEFPNGDSNGGAWAIQGSNGEDAGIDYNFNYYCPNGETDELAWENINGQVTLVSFDVSPKKGSAKFTTGDATGRFVEGSSRDWGLCNGETGNDDLAGAPFRIYMDGAGGSLAKTRGSDSWHIPSESNNHRNDRGLMRMATGFVRAGEWRWTGDGSIGQHSWSQHTNE